MSTFFNKREILDRLKLALGLSSDIELAKFLGVNKSTLSNWVSRNSIDWDLMFSKCEPYSKEWIVSGIGPMYKSELNIIGDQNKIMQGKTVVDNSKGYNNIKIGHAEVKEYNTATNNSKVEKENKLLKKKNEELAFENTKLIGQVELLKSMLNQ